MKLRYALLAVSLAACQATVRTAGGPPPPPPNHPVEVRDHRPPPPPPDRPPPPPPVAGPVWDSTGWTQLGSKTVEGRSGNQDRDTITVGTAAGRFDQLTMVVMDSDIELVDFTVTFANKQTFTPKLRHVFKEGSRTTIIDLPAQNRFIEKIDITYSNLPRGGRARVEIWGRDLKRAT